MTDWMDDWVRGPPFPQADWQKWFAALSAPPGLAPGAQAGASAAGAGPDLGAAGAAYAEMARALARLAELARNAPAGAGAEMMQIAQRLFSQALPRWPAAQDATPEWARALASFNEVLADAARDAGGRFATLVRGAAAPTTLRGLFDAWIECAEAAFQSAAHTERYASAQATLLNEFVAMRDRQQQVVERASRALGQPTRAEVDALHATLGELKRELAALREAAAAAPRDAKPPG